MQIVEQKKTFANQYQTKRPVSQLYKDLSKTRVRIVRLNQLLDKRLKQVTSQKRYADN